MWYMRGSMTMNEAFQLSYEDRGLISDIIKENDGLTTHGLQRFRVFVLSS